MSAIYLSQHQKEALRAVDIRNVEQLVDQALWDGRATALYDLHLSSCGSYVAERLRRFERDLAEYAKSKATKKREQTRSRAWSTGHDLLYAVRDMIQRMEDEEKEIQLFRIDDMIHTPYRFSEYLTLRVNYQWRSTTENEWRFGTITFTHSVDSRPDYTLPQPRRRPSAAKVEEKRQETLYRQWEHLRMLAINAVREFLKAGGDGGAIPETFEAKPAARDRYLNNFSCDFWRGESSGQS
ncbi:MAG TPA: hypothetical protein VF620_12775 [Allosphingosinicella sp.]|jgi:hypothetical protein